MSFFKSTSFDNRTPIFIQHVKIDKQKRKSVYRVGRFFKVEIPHRFYAFLLFVPWNNFEYPTAVSIS